MKNAAKKILAMIVGLAMMLTLQPAAPPPAWASPEWTAVGSPGFSAGLVWYTFLAIGSSGVPYVAYADNGSGVKATVMRYNGAGWETVGSPGFSAGAVNYTSLAIDSGGTPYVAYKDYGNGQKATVMKYSGAGWEAVGSPGFSAGLANYTSLAIGSGGTPYVAYADASNGHKATVMKYSGAGWEAVGSPGFSAGEVLHTSLAIDSSGVPYVAYADDGNGRKATVMKYTGAGWEAVGSPGFSAGLVEYTSLAIDGDGTPYVAYEDYGNDSKATVMKYSGAGWEAVGSPGFSAGEVGDTSLAIDSGGTPYVSYQDRGNGWKATVMKYNGASWEAVGSPGFSAEDAAYTSLAIGSGGTLYLAYRDTGNGDKATVMKYIPDTAAPVLTAGGVSRSSDSEAEVNFTSDEAGRYYYEVAAEGATAPPIDTSGAGTACGAGGQTITLTSLTAGGQDIYIKVKDAAGNVSDALRITIPSLVAGTPTLTATVGDAHVNLSWTPAEGSVSYAVYQSTTSGIYGSALDSVASSVYSYDATGLTNGTTYYFMVKAIDFYGNAASSNEVSATPYRSRSGGGGGRSYPTIKTGEAASITETTADLQGEIKSDGNARITEYGFMYGKDKSSLTQKEKAGTDNYRGGFSFGLSGLEAGDTYYYKAYAYSAGAELYGDVLSFTTEKAIQPGPEEKKPVFTDVPDNHWAYASINKLFGKGCVSGYSDGSFRPDAQITRAEFTTILVKALDLKAAANARNFSDTTSHWAKDSIAAAASLGIVSGYADDSFKPDDPITREQMAVMAVKAAGITAGSGETAFADNAQISSWAKGGVLAAVDADIMNGYPDNTFRPQGNASRAEAVSVILKLMK